MAGDIPIRNIYYLLSYAWDQFRPGEEVDLDADSCPDLVNLLSRMLAASLRSISRLGFERSYREQAEDVSRLRGRVLVMPSYRRGLHLAGRMRCEFDELSFDTLANRVLVATGGILLRCPDLTPENQSLLRHSLAFVPEVSDVRLTDSVFSRVQLHRNTRAYRLALGVCRLAQQCFLPEESSGAFRFRDILRDETVMHRLFERFIFQFAKSHCPDARVSAMSIGWQATEVSASTAALLPNMNTDVTLAWPDRKLIVDCKFYAQALTSRFWAGVESRTFISPHLYQLHAYLTNKATERGWENVEGMLLYPTNGYHLEHSFLLHGKHKVRIQTVDLADPWPEIEKKLNAYMHAAKGSGLSCQRRVG